jgi:hypothetical protein
MRISPPSFPFPPEGGQAQGEGGPPRCQKKAAPPTRGFSKRSAENPLIIPQGGSDKPCETALDNLTHSFLPLTLNSSPRCAGNMAFRVEISAKAEILSVLTPISGFIS